MKRYITFKDYEEILKIGKYWLENCTDELLPDGTTYHHLPLIDPNADPLDEKNYSMDSKYKKQFHKDEKALEKYLKQVEAADKKAIVINYELMDLRQILPPWIIFPHYPANNVFMTPYFSFFMDYTARMTPMELSVYRNMYPVPQYIEQVFMYKEA